MDNKLCRIAVFYDGTYFSKVSNYYAYQHERRARISIAGLHGFIAAETARLEGVEPRHCKVVAAAYFRGRLTAKQALEQDVLFNDRSFEDVLMREDVTLFQQHVNTRPDGTFEEKRIDVALALEAYDMASQGRCNVCVLITGDSDFVPLVRKLNTLGTRVMLLGWDFSYERDGRQYSSYVSSGLVERANYPVMMDKLVDAAAKGSDARIDNLFLRAETQARTR